MLFFKIVQIMRLHNGGASGSCNNYYRAFRQVHDSIILRRVHRLASSLKSKRERRFDLAKGSQNLHLHKIMVMKKLLTGEPGYLGHRLALQAAPKGYAVHALVANTQAVHLPQHANICFLKVM